MPRCRVYYHVVFATKGRQPLLTPSWRLEMTQLLRQKAVALHCVVHAIHVQPDHVHLALSIPPAQPVATVIGQIKGSSSYAINHATPRQEAFGWQLGYGLFTCSDRHLPVLTGYIERQEDHHARQTTIAAYEPSDEDG